MIYEVNLALDPQIAPRYEAWLVEHVKELLRFQGFYDARVFHRDDEDGKKQITVHYYVTDKTSLDRYLREDAPRLRKQATDLFGDRFSASRRVLV